MKIRATISLVLMLAIGLMGCQTASRTGNVATDTVRQHPETVVGTGVGAAGGAVVGGVAGGTKGAIVGGLLGGLAGGVIGNYIERRDDAGASASGVPGGTPSTPPVSSQPSTATQPEGEKEVRMDRVHMAPTVVPPGGTVNLGATYTVLGPANQWVAVRETREVRYLGELVANPTAQVSRTSGTYTTSLPITLPTTAARGPYEVTTTVALGDRRASQTSTFQVQ
jgi:hypothetical protein